MQLILTRKMNAVILTVLAISTYLVPTQTTNVYDFTIGDGDTFRSMVRLTGDGLVAGSEKCLYLFNSSLDSIGTREIPTSNRMLLSIDVPEASVLACQSDECSLHSSNNFSVTYDVEFASGTDAILGGNRDVLGATDGASIFVGRPNDESELVTSSISKLSYTFSSSILDLSLTGAQEESSRFQDRTFLTSFILGDFLYYVFYLDDLDGPLRIARLCLDDMGGSGNSLTTYTEAVLECDVASTVTPTAATFLELNEEPLLILTVKSLVESSNKICLFNITEINQKMDQKLDDCANGIGKRDLVRSGNTNSDCPTLDQGQIDNTTPCSRGGLLRSPLEVDDPITGSNIYSHIATTPFSTVAVIAYQNVTYLYAGTTGAIEQFYISYSDAINVIFIRTIEIVDDEVLDILASEDQSSYYVLTTTKIYKRPVDVCGESATCDVCAELTDPICGWCSLLSICTQRSSCNTSPPEWRANITNCPTITEVRDRIFYTPLANGPPEVNLTTTNIPNVPYDCVFQFAGNELFTVANANIHNTSTTYTCPLPSSSLLPPFDTDTLFADLSLRSVDTDVDVITTSSEQIISFTDCSIQTGCFDCLQTVRSCSWCPLDVLCRSPEETCFSNITGNDPNSTCPFVEPPDRADTNDYLIHVNLSTDLTIRARNLHVFNTNVFNITIKDMDGGLIMALTGVWMPDNSAIIFSANEFDVSLDSSVLLATFQVFWKGLGIENPQKAMMVFYSCPLMGINCGECLSIDSKFRCGYSNETACVLNGTLMGVDMFGECETPRITSFSPTAGPVQGGTKITIEGVNLGSIADQVETIKIADRVNCIHNVDDYIPGRRITCNTVPNFVETIEGAIEIKLKYHSITRSCNPDCQNESMMYRLQIPILRPTPAVPGFGPLSGGTRVMVEGQHLGIGNTRRITMAGQNCVQDDTEIDVDAESLSCTTTASNTTTIRGRGAVSVEIDGYRLVALGFDYGNDPIFHEIQPNFSFASGGTEYTIHGLDLDIVQEPQLLLYLENVTALSGRRRATRQSLSSMVHCSGSLSDGCVLVSEPCTTQSQLMTCEAPGLPFDSGQTVAASLGLLMDGVTGLLAIDGTAITIYTDPVFDNTDREIVVQAGTTTNLTFTGTGFHFSRDQITVQIGELELSCVVTTTTSLKCEIEVPSSADDPLDIQAKLGNKMYNLGSLRVQTDSQLNTQIIIISVFAAVAVFFLVIFIVVVSVLCHKYKLKGQQNDRLLYELEKLETSVAHECKLGFAELQTDLDELTGDLSGSRLPYHDFRTYILQNLFPGAKDHAVLHELELPSYRKAQVERGIKDFHTLILDKTVLLTMIHAMETQRSFTIRDKSNMGSLLMLALHDRLDYATEILKRLLSDLVRRTVAESHPKLLLRRTESVAEKMLSSWLAFTLHDFVVEHAGQPLYLLYKAIKAQLEKGPIDVITGDARYSLSEQKLIRQQVDLKVINSTIATEDGLHVPVKLLDCDSISQAKEKILDAVYKNAPVSQRPPLNKVDLECSPPSNDQSWQLLRDEDGTNTVDYGWRRVNTLQHYRVQDRSVFRLVPRQDLPGPGRTFDYTGCLMVSHGQRNRALSDADDGYRIWHLFQQAEEDPRSSPYMSKKMVTEIYLPRMLSTKTILQKFVDDLFGTIFTLSHTPTSPSHLYTPLVTTFPQTSNGVISTAPESDSLPIAIKYMFDFLDNEASSAKINDPDVVHTWKNNSLALRFWVNLIKNPEFVFDINKSAIVDACLSVTAQAFIDGCSSSDTRPTINSPTSKLLYNKEVQGYKTGVKDYYENIQTLPRIPEEGMMQYLRDLSQQQADLLKKSGEFHIDSALDEILRCAMKHSEPILDALRAAGLESKAQMFESVLRCTM